MPALVAGAPDDGHTNYANCQNRWFSGNMGPVLTGRQCSIRNIGFISSDHMDLNVYPIMGYDIKNVTLEFFVQDASTGHLQHPAAYRCVEGWDNGDFHRCPSTISNSELPNLPSSSGEQYTAIMTLNVNETEIAPTWSGITVPATGVFVSTGVYGFEIWYNHRTCAPGATGC